MSDWSNYNQSEPPQYIASVSWYRKSWGKALIIFFVLVFGLLAYGVYVFFDILSNPVYDQSAPVNPVQELAENLTADSRSAERELAEKLDRPHFGNPEAKIVIVEFSDFQCPVCRSEFPVIRKLMRDRQDDIFFVYRHFPTINENSITVAMASWCAQEQDKFWPMHDSLFLGNQSDFSRNNLINFAVQSGLDRERFIACLDEESYLPQVLDDVKDAASLGVAGTPTFFINGNKLAGAITESQWNRLIDYSLSVLEQNN